MSSVGKIQLYLGCMFSGKTTEAQNQFREWNEIGKKVICINNVKDSRYNDESNMVAHNGGKVPCFYIDELKDIADRIHDYDVVIINEGQFFKNLKNYVLDWCDRLGKYVIVSGLDGDFNRDGFSEVLDLIPVADDYCKMKSRCFFCRDGTEAVFSLRTNNNRDKFFIGGSSEYKPVCRKHYLEKINESDIS
jgi:thymidine kinase